MTAIRLAIPATMRSPPARPVAFNDAPAKMRTAAAAANPILIANVALSELITYL